MREKTLSDIQDQIDKTRDQSDDEFLKKLYTFIDHRERPAPCIQAPPNTYKRQSKRIDELFSVLPRNFRPHSLLDIGCSDGFIAEQFGEALRIPQNSVVGLDIRPPLSKKIRFVEGSGSQFMQELAHSFDLITVSMTLHHIWNYKTVLANCRKYLRSDGILFIREHDA